MGWSSARDTLNEVQLRFATLDEAVAFAEEARARLHADRAARAHSKPKSYADNFRYDRVRT